MYALATTTGVDAVGPLPRAARRLDTGQWVTPPPDGWTDTIAGNVWSRAAYPQGWRKL